VDRVTVNWRLKCIAFHVLARAPGGSSFYRALQRYVTRSHLLKITPTLLRLHLFHVKQYGAVHPSRALEFGGGRSFITPLLLSHAGASEILVYDVDRLSSAAQINDTIRQLRSLVPGEWPEIEDCEEDLVRKYRIKYCAPGDAGATGLASGTVGFICSTSTLEHIPRPDIIRILTECMRIARSGAIFSHVVDYADHYYYGDSSISMFNFYRFSDKQWRWFNPPNHYQNRLRHSDYDKVFRALALKPIETHSSVLPEQTIESVPIAAPFLHYSRSDLLTPSAYFVLERS
jgi:hypothetical protein